MKREKRLYAFVPYQLTGIQKGIQVAHALAEYSSIHDEREDFQEWKNHWKTIIVLDGGTTNEGNESVYGMEPTKGSIQDIMETIQEMGVQVEAFWEPDLNNAMTSFVFIVDEPVFNHEDFPSIQNFFEKKLDTIPFLELFRNGPVEPETVQKKYPEIYEEWLFSLHNEDIQEATKIAKLKNFLQNFRLASN